jgi:hypothetical protein
VPWLKTLDASVAAVNQGGKRKGAACVYLEPWHADVEEFLELRDNTGDEARRTHNLNLANWVPDLFMRRVEKRMRRGRCSIRASCRNSPTCTARRSTRPTNRPKRGQGRAHGRARELYARMMRTLAQTGNGWMTFKDKCNRASNQTLRRGNVIHLSNLCTEILEVTSTEETAVCNLGSINLSRHFDADGQFDFDTLAETVRLAVRQLDRVIDLNFYPIDSARRGNLRWRPVGLGVMGLQDVFFRCAAVRLARRRARCRRGSRRDLFPRARRPSCELAIERGAHPSFADTRARRRAAVRCVGRGAGQHRALGRAARAHPRARPAQLAADRDRADGDHRLHRRLLRVRRAAGQQPVQARDAVGRLPAGQPLPRRGAEEARPVDAGDARCDQAGRRLDPGHRADPRSLARGVPHRVGIPMRALIDMAADRGAFIDQSSR